MDSSEPIIETKNLTIRFGGHVAVNGVNLVMEPLSLISIIGPNGAGKTTLFNLLTGQYSASEGMIFFKGKDITSMGAAMRAKLGIGRSFQLTNIFPNLTVLENVRIAIQSRKGFGLNFWKHSRSFQDAETEAYLMLEDVLLEKKWAFQGSQLTHGEQRKLEIAILLAYDPEIMFLDEPTAGMAQEEVPAILDLLQKIKSAKTRTVLLVEHKMDMIMSLSDKIVVLKDGKLIAEGNPHEISCSHEVRNAYLGGGSRCE